MEAMAEYLGLVPKYRWRARRLDNSKVLQELTDLDGWEIYTIERGQDGLIIIARQEITNPTESNRGCPTQE